MVNIKLKIDSASSKCILSTQTIIKKEHTTIVNQNLQKQKTCARLSFAHSFQILFSDIKHCTSICINIRSNSSVHIGNEPTVIYDGSSHMSHEKIDLTEWTSEARVGQYRFFHGTYMMIIHHPNNLLYFSWTYCFKI